MKPICFTFASPKPHTECERTHGNIRLSAASRRRERNKNLSHKPLSSNPEGCDRDSTSFETLSMPFSTCCLCHNQLHHRIRIEGSCRDRKQSTENDISTGSGSMDSSTCPEFSTHVVSSTGDTSRSPKLDFIEQGSYSTRRNIS